VLCFGVDINGKIHVSSEHYVSWCQVGRREAAPRAWTPMLRRRRAGISNKPNLQERWLPHVQPANSPAAHKRHSNPVRTSQERGQDFEKDAVSVISTGPRLQR
jgi:hypothetical protein